MTIDLDDLERKAKAASWPDDTEPKTREHFSGLIVMQEAVTPAVVLALIERVRELEALSAPLLGADLEPSAPYWPPEEDWDKSAEWCPVPGAARRALWNLRTKRNA